MENEQQLSFTFFGTEGRVRMPVLRPDIGAVLKGGVSENEVSKGWTMLSEGGFDHLIRDCLGLRMSHQLCDWAYLLMLRKMSESYYGGDAQCLDPLPGLGLLSEWLSDEVGEQRSTSLSSVW